MDNTYIDNLVKARKKKKKPFNLQEELKKLEALEDAMDETDDEEARQGKEEAKKPWNKR